MHLANWSQLTKLKIHAFILSLDITILLSGRFDSNNSMDILLLFLNISMRKFEKNRKLLTLWAEFIKLWGDSKKKLVPSNKDYDGKKFDIKTNFCYIHNYYIQLK